MASKKERKIQQQKRLLVWGGSVLGLLIVVGIALWYFIWFQNPTSVVFNSIVNTAKSDKLAVENTKFVAKNSLYQTTATLNGGIANSQGQVDVDLSITDLGTNKTTTAKVHGIVTTDGTAYVKVEDAKKAVPGLANVLFNSSQNAQSSPQLRTIIDQLFQKFGNAIDGKWLKLAKDDKTTSAQNDSLSCLQDASRLVATDKKSTQDLTNAYSKNPFVVVKDNLGSKDGNVGYSVSFDSGKADEFVAQLKGTEVGSALAKCGLKKGALKDANNTYELWISRFSHQLKTLKTTSSLENETTSSIEAHFVYGKDISVSTPSPTVTIGELTKELIPRQQ